MDSVQLGAQCNPIETQNPHIAGLPGKAEHQRQYDQKDMVQ
jgi:hypothetical protein